MPDGFLHQLNRAGHLGPGLLYIRGRLPLCGCSTTQPGKRGFDAKDTHAQRRERQQDHGLNEQPTLGGVQGLESIDSV
jgi:hypothetical protein